MLTKSFAISCLVVLITGCSSSSSLRPAVSNFEAPGEVHSDSIYDSFSTSDRRGRKVDFYISALPRKKLPLFVFVAGSGCESNFWKKDGRVTGGYQDVLLEQVLDRVHVMVVEKPGVSLYEETSTPGTAENCSTEFKREHTLESWSEALNAALVAAMKLPQVDSAKVVAIGHSEGAIAVASLAAINRMVTDVIMLSGNGANQLFDFVVDKLDEEIEQVYRDYNYISKHPDDSKTLFWGHPAKRWFSFFRASTAEFLLNTKARVLLVHGTKDTSIPIQSFDFLVSELKRKDRAFDYQRITDANHGLNLPGESKATGLRREFSYILGWTRLGP